MLYVVASPDLMTAAATNLAEIGSAISTANGAAALPTVEVVAAAADEVSTQIAALFGAHARSYQTLSTQAAAFHSRFVQALTTAAASYASVEAANASPLQVALDVINAPAQTLLGRPLIGNGADGSTPVQAAGQLADPFPLVDVRQDLALGKGAHRFSQLLALRCGPDVHNRVSGISTWRLRSHSPSPLACGSKRAW